MGGKKNRSRQKTQADVAPTRRQVEGGTTAEIGRRGKWTATGAARATRDARIATAAHVRNADIAVRWETAKLMSALDVWRNHLRAQAGPRRSRHTEAMIEQCATDLLFGGSGLAQPYPTGLEDCARAVLRRRADDLDAATLYVLSPSMCDVVIAAAQTLTLDDLTLLGPDDLPSPTGLVMMPHPLIIRTTSGSLGDDRAYVWHTPAQLNRPEPAATARLGQALRGVVATAVPEGQRSADRIQPAVRIVSYMDSYGPVRPDSFRDMAAQAAAAGTPLPPLQADSTRTFPFHPPITDSTREAVTSLSSAARAHGDRWRQTNADLGFDENDHVADAPGFTYRPGDEIDDADDLFSVRFLYAFWRLCGQQVAQLTDQTANHSAQLQADRAGVSPEVRVVTLRAARFSNADREPSGRDWQHRWVVRMHKVRQWYPAEQRHKVIYRGPYVKGPADKPLLGGEVVRAVT